jgi:release factor glutamine methyltransferase
MSAPVPSARDLQMIARLPLIERLIGKAMAFGFRLIGRDRYDDFRLEWVLGRPFVVTPSVFNPKVPRTGEFLAAQLNSQLVASDAEVLDMGTGSGVCAIVAAQHARRVVAVDINPAAVRCAAVNAQLNHLEHKIDILHGDLFDPVRQQRFDLILFNPPFVKGIPQNDRDRAWRSRDVAERFAAGLAARLKPRGLALVVLSTFGDGRAFLEQFTERNFEISVLAQRRFVNERLTIFRLVPISPARDT